MKIRKTKIADAYLIKSVPRKDDRGLFARIFCRQEFGKMKINFEVVQVSQSLTRKKGAIRGLHYQKEPHSEDKLIQCISGRIFDVIIDLRKGSPTFGHWICEELNEENGKILLVPKGCAHGFQTLSDNCRVQYFMNEYYSPTNASGIKWNDPLLAMVVWPIGEKPIVSKRDRSWPDFKK